MVAGVARHRTYKGLQALRIVAAALVVILHSTLYARERLVSSMSLWGQGVTGVDIFFVLSGFVMIYSSDRLRFDPKGWKIFVERRVVRIVPMYWIATTLKLAALLLTSGYVLHAQFSVTKTLCSYFFIPARNIDGSIEPLLGVGWTLNFEMFFYVIFAAALFFQKNVYKFCGSILLLLAAASYFRKDNWPPVSFYLNTIVLEFFFGMLIARICLLNKFVPRKVALPLLVASFWVLLHPWPIIEVPRGLSIGLPAALIVWSTASLEDRLVHLPSWIGYLGDASFMIYLFHPMAAPLVPTLLARHKIFNPSLSLLGSFSIALGVGCLVHQFIELPITKALRERVRVRGEMVIHLPQ